MLEFALRLATTTRGNDCDCDVAALLLLCAPSYLKKIMTKLMLLCFWQHINIIMRSILDEHGASQPGARS